MRTTVRLPPGLMAQVKKLARESGRSMTQVIEDALRVAVARSGKASARTVTIVTVKGDGLQTGVDLVRSAALQDLMESFDPASIRQRARLRASRGFPPPRGMPCVAARDAESGPVVRPLRAGARQRHPHRDAPAHLQAAQPPRRRPGLRQ